MAGQREWLLTMADNLAGVSLGPLAIEDAVRLATRGFAPRTSRELFNVVLDRLDDIRLELERGDFSARELFTQPTKPTREEPVQKWLADRLKETSRGHYTVHREEEVDNKKKPDLRLHNPGCGGPTGIEIKVADRWQFTELESALTQQLAGQYLAAAASNFGALLLFYVGKKRRWKDANGNELTFEEVVGRLGLLAEKTVDGKQVQGLRVVALDCRSPT
jgi:hypothetical protein